MRASFRGLFLCALGIAGVSACVSAPADLGRSVSEDLRRERSIAAPAGDARALASQPLDVEACVQLALVVNPRLQQRYAELGLAQADVYEASRLANPVVDYEALRSGGSAFRTITSVSQHFTELLFLRFNTRLAQGELRRRQQQIAAAVLEHEALVRQAYHAYAAEALNGQLQERLAAVAAAGQQYGEDLHAAGNITALLLSRLRADAAAARMRQLQAEAATSAARARLQKVIGSGAELTFVTSLYLPPPVDPAADAVQSLALRQRLDLAATRAALQDAEALAAHERRWRWLGGLTLGAVREREAGGETGSGPSASAELPVFNSGGARVLRSAARAEMLRAELAAQENELRVEVAAQMTLLRTSAAVIAGFRERLLPAEAQVLAATREQVNFMLTGALDLLAARRQQLEGWQAYLQAVAGWWRDFTELERLAGGHVPGVSVAGAAAPLVAFELPE